MIAGWLKELELPLRTLREVPGAVEIVERAVVYVDEVGAHADKVTVRVAAASALGSAHAHRRADERFTELEALVRNDTDMLVEIYLDRAWRAQQHGNLVLMGQLLARVRALPYGTRHAFRFACLDALWGTISGKPDHAAEALTRARALLPEGPAALAELRTAEFTAHYFRGEFEEAARSCYASHEAALEAQLMTEAATALHNAADAMMRAGDFETARAWFARSQEIAKDHGALRIQHANAAYFAYVDALIGNLDGLTALAHECRLARTRENWFDAVEFAILLGRACLANGRNEAARQALGEAADLAESQGSRLRAAEARDLLAQVGK